MKVGILTSGGDCPGMNMLVYNISKECRKTNIDLFVIKKGFQGLIDNFIYGVDDFDFSNISHLGGSYIKCSRCPYFQTEEGFKKAIENYKSNKFDALIVIGGNGTLLGSQKLSNAGVNVIFIPATIDNDVFYTEKALGFDSALSNVIEALDKINETMKSADRGVVVEVMGRDCPDLADFSALAVDADHVISSSSPYSYEELKNAVSSNTHGFMVVVQENILDVYDLAKKLQNDLDIEVRADILGYLQRGGSPSVFDRIYSKNLAIECLTCLKKKKYNVALGLTEGEVVSIRLDLADI